MESNSLRLIIEAAITRKKKEPPKEPPKPQNRFSIFGAHKNYHDTHQVDKTAIQAKRLNLKYLGFGRYGEIDPATNEYTTTHKVIDGRLTPFTKQAPVGPDGKATKEDWLPDDKHSSLYNQHTVNHEAGRIKTLFKDQKKGGGLIKHRLSKCFNSMLDFCADSGPINKILASEVDPKHANDKIQRIVKDLDTLTKHEAAKLDTDTTFFTGIGHNKAEVGQEFSFAGFMSTTPDPNTALNFVPRETKEAEQKGGPTLHPTMLEITAKKGQNALNTVALRKALESKEELTSKEYEYILPRNTSLKIVDGPIRTSENIMIYKAEISHQDIDNDEDEDKRNLIVPPRKPKS